MILVNCQVSMQNLHVDYDPISQSFSIPNVWGLDGLEKLSGNPNARVGSGKYKEEFEITVKTDDVYIDLIKKDLSVNDFIEKVEDIRRTITVLYQSKGWAFLQKA
jgi:hypothetical protein